MTFSGWPAAALDFYEHLEADNSKTFWQAHKEQYDNDVRTPMELLLAELEPEFGLGKIFRPNRDVRFSADKSPYKTHIGAHLETGGYVQLSADGLACGNGMYQLAPDQLDRYRAAVAEDVSGAELERVIAAVEQDGPQVHGRDSSRPLRAVSPRTTRGSSCCATRAWSPGRSGRPRSGSAPVAPTPGSPPSCAPPSRSGTGWTTTSARPSCRPGENAKSPGPPDRGSSTSDGPYFTNGSIAHTTNSSDR